MQDGDEAAAKLRQAQAAMIGRSLDGLSVADLQTYVTVLQDEIARVERTITARDGVRSAADAVFGKRG